MMSSFGAILVSSSEDNDTDADTNPDDDSDDRKSDPYMSPSYAGDTKIEMNSETWSSVTVLNHLTASKMQNHHWWA